MNLLRAILNRKGFRATIIDRQTVVYRENGRKMTISGEMLTDGFVIYAASVGMWDDSDGEMIRSAERERIIRNVKSSLESQGAKVGLG